VRPHQVVYPVHDLDDGAIRRLAISIESVRASSEATSICIFDTSTSGSAEERIHAAAATDAYQHAPTSGTEPHRPYNKARALNLAFRRFVTDARFFAFDIDIVVPPDFLSSMVSAGSGRAFVAPRLLYMPETIRSYRDFSELAAATPTQHWWGAACLYGSEAFDRVNGFDEDYFGWGNEDDDLQARLEIMTGIPGRTNTIHCFHQYHPRLGAGHTWFSVERRRANENRFRQRIPRYRSGALRVDEVNGLRAAGARQGVI
jgi:hypothetical protein